MIRPIVAALLALPAAAILGCGGAGSGEAPVELPRTFFGVAPQDPTTEVDLARMARGELGSYHLFLSWTRVGRQARSFDWSRYDELLRGLAVNELEPIAYAFGTPERFAQTPSTPPTVSERALRGWERFLKAAATRYGPGGEFWERFAVTNPGVEPRPIRIWEIWNEVNAPAFWSPRPDPTDYATLLKRSERSLHRIDPDAQIMVAGMFATPSSEQAIQSFDYLAQLYAEPGVAGATDLVGVHPYGPRLGDVERQLEGTYEQMELGGDGSDGIWVTEIGWGSDPGVDSDLATTPARQASLLGQAYELLIERRTEWNLQGALWYTWRDPQDPASVCGWCASAGLVDDDLDSKPAWREYTRLTGGEP
jgi:hypothetical protein